MASILALGILLGAVTPLVLGASPAAAHVCTQAVEVQVGKQFNLNIGVAAEDKAITKVEILVPKGFNLIDNYGFLGWVGERKADVVYFSGGTIEPYQCAYFTFKGEIPKKGTYVAEIATVAPDGTRKVYKSHNPYGPVPAMMMYAGVKMPSVDSFLGTSGGSSTAGALKMLAIAVVLGAGAVVIAIRVNARRGAD